MIFKEKKQKQQRGLKQLKNKSHLPVSWKTHAIPARFYPGKKQHVNH